VGEQLKKPAEDAVTALREAMAGDSRERIRNGIDTLSQALTRFAEAARRASATSGQGSGPDRGSGGDDVVDAEFEDVTDAQRRQRG
jgi:molecular chaperone DnaK